MVDKNVIDEGLSEILDLLVLSEDLLLAFEKNKQFTENQYNELTRNIHSMKGLLGMLGFDFESKNIHALETFIINSYQQKGMTLGISDLVLDYFSKLKNNFTTESNHLALNSFIGCFDCLKKHDFEKVCDNHFKVDKTETCLDIIQPKKTEVQIDLKAPVIIVGDLNNFKNYFYEIKMKFLEFNCVNEVYKLGRKLSLVKYILIDLDVSPISPLITQKIILKHYKKIKFVFISNRKESLISALTDFDEEICHQLILLPKSSCQLTLKDFFKQHELCSAQ